MRGELVQRKENDDELSLFVLGGKIVGLGVLNLHFWGCIPVGARVVVLWST